MRVIFVRQFVHLTTYFFSVTDVKDILAELLAADEPVVDAQEVLLLAFLLERIRDVVLVIPWLLPVTVPVGSPFLYIVIGNREEIHSVLDNFLVLLRSVCSVIPLTSHALVKGRLAKPSHHWLSVTHFAPILSPSLNRSTFPLPATFTRVLLSRHSDAVQCSPS